MRNTQVCGGRLIAATGLGLALLAGPMIPGAYAQNIGGQIVKVLGGNDSRQGEKNAMRNLGVGLGAAAAYEAFNHRTTSALILGGGAVLAGKRYEDVRKTQTQENNRFSYTDWRRDDRNDHDNDSWRRGHRNDHDGWRWGHNNDRRQDRACDKREIREDRRELREDRRDLRRDNRNNHNHDWRRNH